MGPVMRPVMGPVMRPVIGTTVLDWPAHFGAMGAEYERRAFAGAALAAWGEHELVVVSRALGPGHGRAVLDVGAGTGRFTRELRLAGWQVTAFDGSAEMLSVIAAASPGVCVVEGRLGEPLPFEDAAFSALTAMRVLKYVPDTRSALRELARVVAPGGRVVFDLANARSLARFGYGRSPMGIVTPGALEPLAADVGLSIEAVHDGPRLPHPVLARATSPTAARAARRVEHTLARMLGPRTAARSLLVVARRVLP